jgi:hypothetical protein
LTEAQPFVIFKGQAARAAGHLDVWSQTRGLHGFAPSIAFSNCESLCSRKASGEFNTKHGHNAIVLQHLSLPRQVSGDRGANKSSQVLASHQRRRAQPSFFFCFNCSTLDRLKVSPQDG